MAVAKCFGSKETPPCANRERGSLNLSDLFVGDAHNAPYTVAPDHPAVHSEGSWTVRGDALLQIRQTEDFKMRIAAETLHIVRADPDPAHAHVRDFAQVPARTIPLPIRARKPN
jgi:hypothetical protein